ncbi:hypothetical protein QYM36_005739 [Artemia franciscana]|uniref:Uncharacterized protein n=1 Tax=Artemia franciscana TaxID=6661 RepID=A0AA88HZ04_ARTSF|nr:hypothetical protein QYM36_005739 [Artemia franciscana]
MNWLAYLSVSIEYCGSGIAQGKDSIPLQGREVDPNRDREEPQPVFDPRSHRNITALAGQSAYLECRVFNLGGRAVSSLTYKL